MCICRLGISINYIKGYIKTQGKIVYISIDFAAKTKMEDAKKIADTVVPLFNDDELEIYDLQFTIVSESADKFVGYTLMGAYNANGLKEIVWNRDSQKCIYCGKWVPMSCANAHFVKRSQRRIRHTRKRSHILSRMPL